MKVKVSILYELKDILLLELVLLKFTHESLDLLHLTTKEIGEF